MLRSHFIVPNDEARQGVVWMKGRGPDQPKDKKRAQSSTQTEEATSFNRSRGKMAF